MVETVFTRVLGNASEEPFRNATILCVTGSIYDREKLGEAVEPASVPEMELPLRVMVNAPLNDPACVGLKTIWKLMPCPAATVAGKAGSNAPRKPAPVTDTPLTKPAPVPWLTILMTALVVPFISTEGKLMAVPLSKGWTLPSASV